MRATPAADAAYEQLRSLLASGSFPAGSRIPPESVLAQRFQVSRPVLRVALARLRDEGCLVSRKGSGSYVVEPPPPLAPAFSVLGNIPDVQRFLEFRCSLESEIAAHAARRKSEAALARIEECRAQHEAACRAAKPGAETDIAFHRAIVLAADNRFFLECFDAFRDQMVTAVGLIRSLSDRPLKSRLDEICVEHSRIAQAILKGDETEARRMMAEHLQGGIRRLFGL